MAGVFVFFAGIITKTDDEFHSYEEDRERKTEVGIEERRPILSSVLSPLSSPLEDFSLHEQSSPKPLPLLLLHQH